MPDRSVKIIVGAAVEGVVNGMRTAKGAVEDFANSADKRFARNRENLDQLADSSLKVGAGLTALAAFAVKSAMDWEVAWTGVLKTVDGTSVQLATLEDDLRGLAKETGFAHREVAAVAEAAGQLGISTGGVADFTETMLAMGVSTNLGAEEAATGLARFRNIMGSSEADIGRMGSTIVGLGNNFATTEQEILEMSLRIAGAGRQAGLTEADVMALAASMSSVGIEAEAGGTAISLTMKRIGREVDLGGDKLGTFARVAGMSAEDFRTAWHDDAAGTLTTFIAGLDRAAQSGESVNGILADLGITGIREADALLRLSGNAEGLADALGLARDEWSRNIALMAEADKFYSTTSQQGKQAWASIKDAAIDAGDAVLPVVADIFNAAGNLAGAFSALPGPVKGGLTAVAGTVGITALAAGGLIKLAGAVQDARDAYDALGLSSRRAVGVVGKVGAAAAILGTVQAVGENLTKRNATEIDELGDSLLRYAEKGKVAGELVDIFGKDFGGTSKRLRKDIDSLGEALTKNQDWADDNFLTRLWRRTGGQGATTGNSGIIYDQVNAIRDMDAALVKMSRNRPDDAIKSFEALRDRAMETGAGAEAIANAFPAMTEILRSASEASGGTSDAVEVLSGSLDELAPAAQESAEELQKAREEAAQIGGAFLDAGDALKGTVGDWGAQLREQTEALRDFRKNAVEALRNGADETLIDYLVSQGPAGAAMLKQLADGSEDAAKRISKDWRGSQNELAKFIAFRADLDDWTIVTEFKTAGADGAIEKAADVAAAANMTPEQVETVLRALDYSTADIKAVLALLDSMPPSKTTKVSASVFGYDEVKGLQTSINKLTGKTVVVRVVRKGTTGGGITINADGGFHENGVKAYADGGMDERGREVQRVPQMRSGSQGVVMWGEAETGWEAYISGKPGKEARNRDILAMAAKRLGGVVAFADGGFTEAMTSREYAGLRARERDLMRSLRETEKYGKGNKKTRLALRGWDRREAAAELREVRADIAEQNRIRRTMKRKGWKTAGRYNREMERREDAQKARDDAREKAADDAERAKENRQSEAASFASGLSGDAFKSPATLEQSLRNLERDNAEYVSLLAALRKAGASEWLLEQIRTKAGPSRSTNRTLRALLGDSERLRRMNQLGSSIVSTANQYAALTTGPGFTAAYSGSAAIDYDALARALASMPAPIVTPATAGWIGQQAQQVAVQRG